MDPHTSTATSNNGGLLSPAYSIPDAVAVARVGRSTLYKEIKCGRLRARKVGNRSIILADDLRAWLHNLPAA